MHGKFCVPCQGLALGHLIVSTRMFWSQLWCLVCHQSQSSCACLCRLTLAAHTSLLLSYWTLRSLRLFASHFSCMYSFHAFPLRFLCCHSIVSFLCLNEPKPPLNFKCFNKCYCQAASDTLLWCSFQRRPLTCYWREKRQTVHSLLI